MAAQPRLQPDLVIVSGDLTQRARRSQFREARAFLDRLSMEPLTQERFDMVRGFLPGYPRLWEQSDQRRLGYAIDSLFYGTPDFLEQYRSKEEVAKMEELTAPLYEQFGSLSPETAEMIKQIRALG